MKTPLVSVIIPIYNMENYLGETIESVLLSTYKNLEIVLVDDGSTDSSFAVAQAYAQKDSRIKAYSQPNSGVCRTRNYAVEKATGELIFPLDSDDKITVRFLEEAVQVIVSNPDVKVVHPRAEFFGDRSGEWKLKPFSRRLLARRNMIPVSGLYWKKDWERVGGYCEEMPATEDWDFWISVLKDGGKVVKLPTVGFYYRIRKGSKRISDRKHKRAVIDMLNERHKEFFESELGGKLHYQRTWSRIFNRINKIFKKVNI